MFPSRQTILLTLRRLRAADMLPQEGTVSVFLKPDNTALRLFPCQLSVTVCSDSISVHMEQLFLRRTLTFSPDELNEED